MTTKEKIGALRSLRDALWELVLKNNEVCDQFEDCGECPFNNGEEEHSRFYKKCDLSLITDISAQLNQKEVVQRVRARSK